VEFVPSEAGVIRVVIVFLCVWQLLRLRLRHKPTAYLLDRPGSLPRAVSQRNFGDFSGLPSVLKPLRTVRAAATRPLITGLSRFHLAVPLPPSLNFVSCFLQLMPCVR
jgi:hypothetical protein